MQPVILAVFLAAASAQVPAPTSKVIEVMSEQLTDSDFQTIADSMVASLTRAPHFAALTTPPRMVVGKIANTTREPFQLEGLGDRIQIAMVKTGRFEALDAKLRQAIAQEYEYQQSGYVDPNKAKGPGAQASADYIITGTLSGEPGRYQLVLSASELSTSVMRWADDREIRVWVPPPPPGYGKLRKAGLIGGGIMLGAGLGLIFLDRAYSNTGYGHNDTVFHIGIGLAITGPVLAIAVWFLAPVLMPEKSPVAGLSFGVDSKGFAISYSGSF